VSTPPSSSSTGQPLFAPTGRPPRPGPNWRLLVAIVLPIVVLGSLLFVGLARLGLFEFFLPPYAYSEAVSGMTAGSDGNMWFVVPSLHDSHDALGRITPSGQITLFPMPSTTQPGSDTIGPTLVSGADGALWFLTGTATQAAAVALGRFTTDGHFSALPLPPSLITVNGQPAATNALAAAPDGSFWIAGASGLVRVTTAGEATAVPLPTPDMVAIALAIAPSGTLWYVERWSPANQTEGQAVMYKVGYRTAQGQAVDFPLDNVYGASTGVAIGPDGAAWVGVSVAQTEIVDQIWSVTSQGTITKHPIAENRPGSGIGGITAGPAGTIWLTIPGSEQIGRLSPSGQLARFDVPRPFVLLYPSVSNGLGAIAPGPDGNLWFSASIGKIGRITPTGALTVFVVPGATIP
jgi:virginiamycin B lyase